MADRQLDGSWITAYLAYTHESAAPEVYHKWCALSAIAGAIRRRVYFAMEYFLHYPNMYVVLVSPPGICHKSTAMRIGNKILTEVPGVYFSSDSTTRERLIQDMTQACGAEGHSSMTAHSTEFATMFASSGVDMMNFLTDIYDSPPSWAHASKMGGQLKIKAPYLNMLGATTPRWISSGMPLDTIGTGLTSRIVFVYQDKPRVRPWRPKLSAAQRGIRDLLVTDLQQIANLSGEYRMADDADKAFDQWHMSTTERPNSSGDPRLDGYFARKEAHTIKLAMLVAASFRDDLVITLGDLQEAWALLNEAESFMPYVFANVGKNPLAVDYTEVMRAIITQPGIRFATLMMMFKHSMRKTELQEVIDTLVAGNVVRADPGATYSPIFKPPLEEPPHA